MSFDSLPEDLAAVFEGCIGFRGGGTEQFPGISGSQPLHISVK